MRIQLSQTNPCVGDLKSNLALIESEIAYAAQQGVDVLVLPELVTTGYPPRDFLYRSAFWESNAKAVEKVHQTVKRLPRQMTVIFGALHQQELTHGRFARFNAAYVVDRHRPSPCIVHKQLLPCYDIFDEGKYFTPGDDLCMPVNITTEAGETSACSVLICEDIWNFQYLGDNRMLPGSYKRDPVGNCVGTGPIFVINGSPFWKGKVRQTLELVESICVAKGRPVIYCNQVGAHDDIVTHGGSIVSIPPINRPAHAALSIAHRVCSRIGKLFATDRMIVDISHHVSNSHQHSLSLYPDSPVGVDNPLGLEMPEWNGKKIDSRDFDCWCDFHALRLHIIDYFRRTGFKEAVLGLSGGIDSAVVAAIAASALGGQNVHGVTMPSKHSSEGSWKDAEELATNLNLGSFQNLPIQPIYAASLHTLLSGGKQKFEVGVTDENLQPRARMLILMGLSNDNGWLVLTTGNKSELAVGYCTLYGDMSGGLAVISDIPKTQVYDLAKCINKYAGFDLIPSDTITKPPSAELAPDQLDTNSLPPYEELDLLLEMIYDDVSLHDILSRNKVAPGISATTIQRIVQRVTNNEYKRRQTPDGPKVRKRSFGSGRRMPVAARYRLV